MPTQLPASFESAQLQPINVASASALEDRFDALDYAWPPGEQIPALSLQTLPADFADMRSSTARKHLFLRTLLPIVLMENRRLREQRQHVILLLDLPPAEGSDLEKWLIETARQYRIKGDLRDPKNRTGLLKKLDEIPPRWPSSRPPSNPAGAPPALP